MQLQISLFGLPAAQWIQTATANEAATNALQAHKVKLTRTVEALLMYLLVQRRNAHTRESLIGVFWADHSDEQARGCLSTALWRLRRALEPDATLQGQILVTTPQGEVSVLRSDKLWLDIEAFEDAAQPLLAQPAQALTPASAHQLKNAISMYTGPLLEGFYDDWALRERERLRTIYLNGMLHLMRYCRNCAAYEEAIGYARSILEEDSLREDVHRTLMRLYHESGQRTRALQHYEQCRQLLWQELGIEPMAETQALSQLISQNNTSAPPPTDDLENNRVEGARAHSRIPSVYQQLKSAISELDSLRQRLQSALESLGS